MTVSSVSIGRARVVIRGRISTGASARLLRVTLKRTRRGHPIRLTVRAGGGRTGSWKAVIRLPREARGVTRFAATLHYLGEAGYLPALVRFTARSRHFSSR
jgi:hypothetical protein